MKPADWDAVYGNSVRILNEDIISSFRPEQIEVATGQAQELSSRAFVLAKGVLR
jgi:hypothetical protein